MMPTEKANMPNQDPTGGLINSPALTPQGKEPSVRSIRDAAQARDVIRTLIQANRQRQVVNGRITAKINAERPYEKRELEEAGLGWRSNFTTKPLPAMLERVAPRFVEAVNGVKYLTNASLPSKYVNATAKTEAFRDGITKLIRGRVGWRTLVEDIAQENALFGYTVVAWEDEFSWFPTHFKQDEVFLSSGTKQLSDTAQIVVLKETYLPHELFAKIRDREAARMAGWNIENTLDTINRASPSQLRSNLSIGGQYEAFYQNLIRELNVGASYMDGASVVVSYSLLVREVTGKVSHYRLAGDELLSIFEREDRFDSMSDAVAFFAFQKGNGTMHGSKGIGRDIYELAAMIDRTRNEVVDRLNLSGKTLVQGDPKQINKFKMSVIGACLIMPQGWNVLPQKFDGNVEAFIRLDSYFGILIDQLVGSTSPRFLEGERVTAAQVNLFASREEEAKDTRISRFLEFFVGMVRTMQRRICSPSVSDDDAKEFRKAMLDLMSAEELALLARQPVAETVRDLSPADRQLVVQLATEKRGNSLYNQRALEEADLTARLDADFANKVLMPENDPTVAAEQARQQQFELVLIQSGQSVPVSPRDNHEIHLRILMPVAEKMAQLVVGGQLDTPSFEVVVAHISEHFSLGQQTGLKPEVLTPVKQFISKAGKVIAGLRELDAQAQGIQMQSAQLEQESMQEPTPA